MHDCTVISNKARSGGGVALDGGTLSMNNCTLRENDAVESGSSGASAGGLRIAGAGNATLTGCVIETNTSDGPGGGIQVAPYTELALAGDTRLAGNTASTGGGIFVDMDVTNVTIGKDCRITGNTATGAQGGGGIYSLASTPVILEGDSPTSPIVHDNCPDTCAGGDVPTCASGGACLES